MVGHIVRPGNSGLQASPHYIVVTPSDTVDLPFITRALYVGADGDVSVMCPGTNSAVLFKAVKAGTTLHIQTTRVLAATTTATNIAALG
jgi:hypothetical protein